MQYRGFTAFTIANSLSLVIASSAPGIRGVGPAFEKYYQNTESFTCISNPSITIPYDNINDDYCDCPDGSDEPGTSACSHISPHTPPTIDLINPAANHTPALPGFYCKNAGHKPAYVPFRNVNDGVCDYDVCCDGSDEAGDPSHSHSGVKCEDKCKEMGAEARKADAARTKRRNKALQERQGLVAAAAKLRSEVEARLLTLQQQLVADRGKVANAERELAEVERAEKLRVVKAPKVGGRLGVLSGLAKQRITELKESLTSVRESKNQAEDRVRLLEDILEKFKVEYNPNFNDEGVKRAVRAWEDYASAGKLPLGDIESENDVELKLRDDSEHGIIWEDFEEADSENSMLYNLEDYLPPSLREWLMVKVADFRELLIENGLLARQDSAVGDSKVVTDARDRLNTAISERDGHQRDIETDEDDLKKDYGPDDIFRSLKGQCIENESGEYVYEVCFLGQTTQKSRNGGMNTNMGNFDRIEWVLIEDENSLDASGTVAALALKYDNGAQCWNGPARSTSVIVTCSDTNSVQKVIEEEKCIYKMEITSPAACLSNDIERAAKISIDHKKDEL